MSKRRQKITFLENMIVSHSLLSVRITVWPPCSSGHVNSEDLLQLLPSCTETKKIVRIKIRDQSIMQGRKNARWRLQNDNLSYFNIWFLFSVSLKNYLDQIIFQTKNQEINYLL